jgi:diguanylate cyclase (GGDEF)-like protein/PAS domain S-box-containing protein
MKLEKLPQGVITMMDLELYRLIVESSPNMIWRANLSTECDYFNKTWLDFTGRTFEQELGFGWAEGVHPEDLDRCVKIYLDNFHKQTRFEMDYRLKNKNGEYRWINDRGVPFYDNSGQFIGFIGSCMDVTEKIEGQLMMKMAQNDFLCNTYNRQYAYQLLQDVFNRAKEHHYPLTIMMIDIDEFKAINDQYGHAAGDLVLTKISASIKSMLQANDILGRYGGDEFLVGLDHKNKNDAIKIAESIKNNISCQLITISEGNKISITISVGIKCLENELTLDELINKADICLYTAKKEGRNRVIG